MSNKSGQLDRPTPETDKNIENIGMGCQMVSVDFARILERERDEARKESEYYKARYEQLKDEQTLRPPIFPITHNLGH